MEMNENTWKFMSLSNIKTKLIYSTATSNNYLLQCLTLIFSRMLEDLIAGASIGMKYSEVFEVILKIFCSKLLLKL